MPAYHTELQNSIKKNFLSYLPTTKYTENAMNKINLERNMPNYCSICMRSLTKMPTYCKMCT